MSVVSGIMGAMAAGDAADKSAEAQKAATASTADIQNKALDLQQKNFNLVQGQEAPYRAIGEKGVAELSKMLSGGYNMQESPSAKYAMQQGTKSINANLGARGLEGNAVQQLGQLSSSTAASDYSNRFNQLLAATNIGTSAVAGTASSAASLGQAAQSGANTQTSALQSAAGNLGSIYSNAGNQTANIIGSSAGTAVGVGSQLLGSYLSSGSAAASTPAVADYASYAIA